MRAKLCGLLAVVFCCGAVASPSSAAVTGLPPVRHVWIFMLENKSFFQTFGPGLTSAPYLTLTLPSEGMLLPFYYGIGHSSLDNYIAILSGQAPAPQTQDDCGDSEYHLMQTKMRADGQAIDTQTSGAHGCIYPSSVKTLADQLSARGLTWKGYNEGIPAPCSPKGGGEENPHYKRKHNPYMFFQTVLDSGLCAKDVIGLPPLATDLEHVSTTPNFSFVIPDQCNDAHDQCEDDDPTSLGLADKFLKNWIPKITASPAYKQDGLIIVTFDEGNEVLLCCNEQPGPNTNSPGGAPGTGGGLTGAVLLSPFIRPGSISLKSYNHYSLLRSLEDMFGIDEHLGYAAQRGLTAFGADIFNNPDGGLPAPPEPQPVIRPRVSHLALVSPRRPRPGHSAIRLKVDLTSAATLTATLRRGSKRVAQAIRHPNKPGLISIKLPTAKLRAGTYTLTVKPTGGKAVVLKIRVKR